MKKRIAFLGLSYPLMFDSTRAEKSWMSHHPTSTGHPVIGSGNGLLIMYDEIWFLTKDLCPINMQYYDFVKYVDEMNLPINYDFIIKQADMRCKADSKERPKSAMPFTTYQIEYLLDLPSSITGYTEFTGVGVNNHGFTAGPCIRNYIIDFLIVTELQRLTKNYYELVSNINIRQSSEIDSTNMVEFTHQLFIDSIPDIIEQYGPCSPDIWKLRESDYLCDFRAWMVENHSHIQKAEIMEMKEFVQHQVDVYRDEVFLKQAEKSLAKNVIFSAVKNCFNTALGSIPIVGTYYGIGQTALDTGKEIEEAWKFKNNRWMAFLISAKRNQYAKSDI